MRTKILKIIDIILDPRAMVAAVTWPKFSYTSYKNVRSLNLQNFHFPTIIDVGSNTGQFAIAAQKLIHPEKIFCFEPVSRSFDKLLKNTKRINSIECRKVACGAGSSIGQINVNKHSQSSSILHRTNVHEDAFPSEIELKMESIQIETLDDCLSNKLFNTPALLKIDVQGFESDVLEGSKRTLSSSVEMIMIETSFKELYDGEKTFESINRLLASMNFALLRPISFMRDDRTDEVLQMDCLYVKQGSKYSGGKNEGV